MSILYISAVVVDDEPANLLLAQRVLAQAGWEVRTASSGADAIVTLRARHADLVIMDVQMPLMDGIETIARLRRFDDGMSGVPILAWTARAMAPNDLHALGFDGSLPKPCTPDVLLAEVAGWVPGRDDGIFDRLQAVFDPVELATLHARLRRQLVEALAAPSDTETAHRIAGAAGTLGFPDVSAAWLRVANGDGAAWPAARKAARRAVAALDRAVRIPRHAGPLRPDPETGA